MGDALRAYPRCLPPGLLLESPWIQRIASGATGSRRVGYAPPRGLLVVRLLIVRIVQVVLLTLAVVMLSATHAMAQASAELFVGPTVLVTANGSDEFALPTDNHGVAGVVGLSVWSPASRWSGALEGEWSRTMTGEVPGAIKAGPVTYVISQRPRLGSALVGFAAARSKRVRVVPALGVSVVQNTPTVRYSFQQKSTLASEQTNLAWSGGLDIVASGAHLVLRVPRVRVHYVTGIEREFNGFGAPRVIWSAGVTLGWRF